MQAMLAQNVQRDYRALLTSVRLEWGYLLHDLERAQRGGPSLG